MTRDQLIEVLKQFPADAVVKALHFVDDLTDYPEGTDDAVAVYGDIEDSPPVYFADTNEVML